MRDLYSTSSRSSPPLKSVLWFWKLYTECDLILCPFFFFFSSCSQVPPLILFLPKHRMWSHPLSLLLLLLLLLFSSPSSDFVFSYTHDVISSFVPSSSSSSPLLKSLLWFCFFFSTRNVISLILCPLCKNDQYKALKSFLRFCFFFLYTQCDLSHPLSLVSKWSIQSSQVIPPILFFFSIHTMWSLTSFVPCVKMINTRGTHLRFRTTSQEVPHQLLGTYPNLTMPTNVL